MRTRYNEAAAQAVVDFFPKRLAHVKGPAAGRPFELEQWQQDAIVRPIFGRQRYDDELERWVRQIRTAYVEIPRKNGKSAVGAGIGLYLTFADRELGAEVYSVAEDLDTANKVFDVARRMVEASPVLDKRSKTYKRVIEVPKTGNIYRVLPGDAVGNHGHNPHGVIFDELHTQPTRELWDVMTSGQGTRAQPLTVAFSTAGYDRESVCWEQHEYGERLRKRILTDPAFHYVRFGLEEGDDWESEDVWRRCNPALGKFLLLSFLRDEYTKAKASPARQNMYRRLYLNEWTQQATRWIDLGLWDQQAGLVDEAGLRGRECYGGLDIAAVSDVTAWVLVFPRDDGHFDVLPRFWLPEAVLEGPRRDVYLPWVQQGFVKTTPGNAIDQDFIVEQIITDARTFNLRTANIDWLFQGQYVAGRLMDERLPVQRMRQGHLSFALPMKEFERRLLEGQLHHGGNPVLRWMADNVVVRQDAAGNLKPDKDRSQEKIDGIVALVMAISGWLDRPTRRTRVASF